MKEEKLMKKIIALALSLMMLLGCVSAFAETAEKETITMMGAFSITFDKLPADYTLAVQMDTEMAYAAAITSEDAAKPKMLLTMAFSDQWDGVNTLADATEDDLAAVKQDFYDVAELDEGDLSVDTALDDIDEYDSMAKLSLIVLMEDEFDVKLTGDVIKGFETVGDIVKLMDK